MLSQNKDQVERISNQLPWQPHAIVKEICQIAANLLQDILSCKFPGGSSYSGSTFPFKQYLSQMKKEYDTITGTLKASKRVMWRMISQEDDSSTEKQVTNISFDVVSFYIRLMLLMLSNFLNHYQLLLHAFLYSLI